MLKITLIFITILFSSKIFCQIDCETQTDSTFLNSFEGIVNTGFDRTNLTYVCYSLCQVNKRCAHAKKTEAWFFDNIQAIEALDSFYQTNFKIKTNYVLSHNLYDSLLGDGSISIKLLKFESNKDANENFNKLAKDTLKQFHPMIWTTYWDASIIGNSMILLFTDSFYARIEIFTPLIDYFNSLKK